MNRVPVIAFLLCFLAAHLFLNAVIASEFFMGGIGMPDTPFFVSLEMTPLRFCVDLFFALILLQQVNRVWRNIQS